MTQADSRDTGGSRWRHRPASARAATTAVDGGAARSTGAGSTKREDQTKIAIVSFSHAVQHSYVAMLGIAYPFILATFHQTYAALGIVLGIAGVSSGLLQGLAAVVKKLSARLLLGLQNVVLAAMVLVAAVSPGLAVFGAARVVGSLSSWAQHPVGSAYVTEHFPKNRGRVLSYLTTGGNIGTLVAPLIGGVLIATVGWRWALSVFAIPLVASGLWTLTRLADDHGPAVASPAAPGTKTADGERTSTAADSETTSAASSSGRPSDVASMAPGSGGTASMAVGGDQQSAAGETVSSTDADASAGAAGAGGPRGLGQALRSREAVAVLVAGMVSGAGRGLGVLTTYVPAYLRTGLHLSPITVGLVVTVVSIGAVFGPLVGGRLSDRIGRRPVLFVIYFFGAAALAGFVFAGANAIVLGAVGVGLGIFAYSEQPIRQALFSDAMHGVSARKAFGAYFAISQSVGSLWLVALGFLITDVSFKAAFITMGASFVLAGSIIAVFSRGGRPEPVVTTVTAGS